MVRGCKPKCLQLTSLSHCICSHSVSSSRSKTWTNIHPLHSDKKCRSLLHNLRVVQSDVCRGQHVSSNWEWSGRLWWRIRKPRKWPLMTEEGCVFAHVCFLRTCYMWLLYLTFPSVALNFRPLQSCRSARDIRNIKTKGTRV